MIATTICTVNALATQSISGRPKTCRIQATGPRFRPKIVENTIATVTSGVTFGTSSTIRQNVWARRLRLFSSTANHRESPIPGIVEIRKIAKVLRSAFQKFGSEKTPAKLRSPTNPASPVRTFHSCIDTQPVNTSGPSPKARKSRKNGAM